MERNNGRCDVKRAVFVYERKRRNSVKIRVSSLGEESGDISTHDLRDSARQSFLHPVGRYGLVPGAILRSRRV